MNYNDLKSIFFKFEPENIHNIVEKTLYITDRIAPGIYNFVQKKCIVNNSALYQNLFDMSFYNPVGLAGGFDKNATMIRPLSAFGFGFLEFGTITPLPQIGNEKPRLFRLVEEESIQNAMGFNNDGSDKIAKRIETLYPFAIPLFANIGKNKITPNDDAICDYEKLVSKFNQICDIFVINISSPNTPNLRDLQDENFIKTLFDKISALTNKPIILKIAPDMSEENAINLCTKAVECGAKGLIINNTSIDYSLSKSQNLQNFGGLSGKVISQKSKKLFKSVANELYGKCILIASGGIDSPQEAYERIKMGANLVEIYTSFIFNGPSITKQINDGILELLQQDGFENISQAVGCEVKK